LEHLNWQLKTIEFAQHKTGKKVSYPILDDVGWALIEYLRDGRPNIDNPYVFLIHVGVPKEFNGGSSLCGALLRRMKLSGLRKEAPRTSIGPHSLRHAVARRIVCENVDLKTAANILGDTTLKAASIYLRSDVDGLRECALSSPEVSVC
jgi:integrase